MSHKTYTVSEGDLVLTLEALPKQDECPQPWIVVTLVLTLEALPKQDGGGYGVTSPLEPQLVTEAQTIEEAFEMARDALQGLRESRQRSASTKNST